MYIQENSIEEKVENKIEVNLNVRLTKAQLSKVKSFIGLTGSTDNETSLKALIMAVSRGSIQKVGY